MTGLAPASRIRGGTLEGPGPNMWRCGTTSGLCRRSGGGTERDDMFPAEWAVENWVNAGDAEAWTEAHPSARPVGSWAHRVSQHRVSLSLWSSANSDTPLRAQRARRRRFTLCPHVLIIDRRVSRASGSTVSPHRDACDLFCFFFYTEEQMIFPGFCCKKSLILIPTC